MNNSYKHIALGSVFLVLVLLSVYMVFGDVFLTILPVNFAGTINGSNLSGSVTITVNFTISDPLYNFTNATLIFYGTEYWFYNFSMLSSSMDNLTFVVNTINIADGVKGISANVTRINNTGSVYWNSTFKSLRYNVTIDNTAPTINYQGLTPENNSYRAIPSIYINVTAIDTLYNVTTFYLYNSTPTQINSTEVSPTGSSVTVAINFTALSDGVYTYNVTAVDYVLNSNVSMTKTITLDTTAPSSATITVPSINTESGADVTITCGRADATAGINNTVLVITKPNDATITRRDFNVTTSGTGTYVLGSGSDKDLNQLGTYKVDCTVKDRANNSLPASQKTFVISSADSGGGGGTTITTHTLGTVTTSGITKLIKQNDKARFTLAGTSHTATVTNVGTTSASIKIESDPITLSLDVGETKKIDFEQDNVYDMALTLISIVSGKANIEFKAVTESYTGEAVPVEGGEEVTEEEEPIITTTEPSMAWLWWTIGVIIVIVIIALIYSATKKKPKRR